MRWSSRRDATLSVPSESASRSLAAIEVALLLGGLLTMIAVSASAAFVAFPDAGLEAAIRDAIGKPTGDIQEADLTEVTFLNADDRNISDLEGIQHCVALTELHLDDNQIMDISALSGLTNLRKLYLSNNRIVNITPLEGLTNLTDLYLYANQIINLQALVNNAGLDDGDWVGIRDNYIDLTPGSQDMLDIEALQRRGVAVVCVQETLNGRNQHRPGALGNWGLLGAVGVIILVGLVLFSASRGL